ncbi:hypothetical protein [Streptomyces sp. RKND-216]|uniref:hypothetical protein n=1 Tax=Streptomyces sp. RKND-216 TaxID=2562581 RepID=UPI001B34B370|nr:hypothetical protein [Streptomyces sp. RKND-216]
MIRTAPPRPAAPAAPRRSRAALAGTLAALPLLAVAGCGIQPTSVPVDAGAAPSRVACVLPDDGPRTPAPRHTVVRVYLVCGSRVSPVQRSVRLPAGRADVAGALLETLSDEPGPRERAAGFASQVPPELEVGPGTRTDPPGTLRLSTAPSGLPPFALAQIVCTFAETEAGAPQEGTVVLAGPADAPVPEPPRRIACTTELRNSPDAADRAGTPVGS